MHRGVTAPVRARATCQASSTQPFEALESRQLLSVDNPVVAMNWQGQSVKVEAGEYILSLDPSTRIVSGRDGGGQVAAVQRLLDGRGGTEGFKVEEYLGRPGEFLLDVPQDRTPGQVQSAVKGVRGFQFVEPNVVFQLQATTPNDPYFGLEYGLDNSGTTPLGASKADADIDAPEAWDITTGAPASGSPVVVGVVDTGVDYTHPDLAANMWRNPGEVAGDGIDNDADGYVDDVYGINAYANNGNPMDDVGHGTHVAGTIAAVTNNGEGVAGVAWNAKVMALKFIGADGAGSTADAIECLNYAVTMRNRGVNIRLTSNSWGGGGFETALRDAIARSNSAGMLFVVAAGNGGDDGVSDNNDVYASYPSNYDVANVVAVAATDRNDQLAGFSNYGAATVDLAAPGVDVASTKMGGGYLYMSGTSMATPHVSGVAALAFAYKPTATVAEVRGALLGGVDKLSNLSGKVASGGRLNALGTLRAIGNSLSGVAYNDADGNGSRGGAEAALAGRTVYLDVNNNSVADVGEPTRATDTAGAFRFGGLVPGTYTVRQVVPSGWVGTSPGAGAYTVALADGQNLAGNDFGSRVGSADDPNDQLAEAFALGLGTAASGAVGDGGVGGTDVDTFSFAAVAGQRVGFDVDAATGGTLDSYLRVFDAAGAQLAANDNGAAAGEVLGADSYAEYTFGSAGTYYVSVSGNPNRSYNAVTGAGDVAGSTGAYTVSLVSQVVGSDDDDQLGEATPLTVGATASDAVSNTDVDMDAVTALAGQRLGFDVDRPAGSSLDSYLRVFDADGRPLAVDDNGAAPGEALSPASYVEVTFPTAGTYFVGVSASPNKAYSPVTGQTDLSGRGGAYTLTVNGVAPAASATTASVSTWRTTSARGLFSDVKLSSSQEVESLLDRDVLQLL
jgi:subtilisin family serine protease